MVYSSGAWLHVLKFVIGVVVSYVVNFVQDIFFKLGGKKGEETYFLH